MAAAAMAGTTIADEITAYRVRYGPKQVTGYRVLVGWRSPATLADQGYSTRRDVSTLKLEPPVSPGWWCRTRLATSARCSQARARPIASAPGAAANPGKSPAEWQVGIAAASVCFPGMATADLVQIIVGILGLLVASVAAFFAWRGWG